MFTHGIPPAFRDGVHLYRQPPLGQSRVDQVMQLRTDGVHCRECVGTEPVVLSVVPVTGAVFSGITMDQLMCASFFPRPLLYTIIGYKGDMLMYDTESIGGGYIDFERS